jgi:hypothetical protein
MIPRDLLDAWITGNPHSAFHKPVKLYWWTHWRLTDWIWPGLEPKILWPWAIHLNHSITISALYQIFIRSVSEEGCYPLDVFFHSPQLLLLTLRLARSFSMRAVAIFRSKYAWKSHFSVTSGANCPLQPLSFVKLNTLKHPNGNTRHCEWMS